MEFSRDHAIYCQQGPHELPPSSLGTLTGYKFVFKDLFDVKGYKTGVGNPSWLKSHAVAEETSPLIKRLLAVGAECVGRVQTDELAYSLNGQNIHYGTPQNPLAPDCLPGGSSSGSAVAVARKEADFSIGTDTGGSIRVPSSYCGLFGIRPTLGLLDLSHCFELSVSFDTAGVMARSLTLLDTVFSALLPKPSSVPEPTRIVIDQLFLPLFGHDRLTRLNRALDRAGYDYSVTDVLRDAEWNFTQLSELFRIIQGYEIIQQHGDWLAQYGHTLDQSIGERVAWARTITPEQYQNACEQQQRLKDDVTSPWLSDGTIALLPTTPSGPPPLTMPAKALAQYRSDLMGLTAIAGLAGLPQLHLPMAKLAMGPAGISLLGAANADHSLFELAKLMASQGAGL
jgi:aspartyl-tRNA(Asn)/glutamyl-tRNA(Gln) amidotransferase subunit A